MSENDRLTVGKVRKAIEGLPDDTLVMPEWFDIPGDDQPCVRLHYFRAGREGLEVGVSLVPLYDEDEDYEEDEEDQECEDFEYDEDYEDEEDDVPPVSP